MHTWYVWVNISITTPFTVAYLKKKITNEIHKYTQFAAVYVKIFTYHISSYFGSSFVSGLFCFYFCFYHVVCHTLLFVFFFLSVVHCGSFRSDSHGSSSFCRHQVSSVVCCSVNVSIVWLHIIILYSRQIVLLVDRCSLDWLYVQNTRALSNRSSSFTDLFKSKTLPKGNAKKFQSEP